MVKVALAVWRAWRVTLFELVGAGLLITAAAQLAVWAALAVAGVCALLKSMELDLKADKARRNTER